MILDSRSMAEHNLGTLYSLLIIFCFTKFVSENSLKMKAKFLVGKKSISMILSTKKKEGPHRLSLDWNQLEYLCFSDGLSSAPSRTDSLRLYPSHQSPHSTWALQPGEVGMMGMSWLSSPSVRAHLGHPEQSVSSVQCQFLVALTLPVPSSFPLSSSMSDTSWLLLATEDHSFSRSSGWLSGSPFSCPQDNHPKMMEPCSFASYSETALRKG